VHVSCAELKVSFHFILFIYIVEGAELKVDQKEKENLKRLKQSNPLLLFWPEVFTIRVWTKKIVELITVR
jgi:hypothetical protein